MKEATQTDSTVVVPGGNVERHDGVLFLNTVSGSYRLGNLPDGFDLDAVVERLADGCRPTAVAELDERAADLLEQLLENGAAVAVDRPPGAVDTNAVRELARYHRQPARVYETAVDTVVAVVGDCSLEPLLRSFGVADVTDEPEAANVTVGVVPEFSDQFAASPATPFVSVFDDEGEVCVGPVISTQTVCDDCYRRRRASTRESPAEFERSRGTPSTLGGLTGAAAGLASIAVICSRRPDGGPLATRQVTVDPVTLESETHGVFPVPGCETCD